MKDEPLELTLDRFAGHVGEMFGVRAASGEAAEICLVEAESLTERMQLPDGFREPFHLVFHGAKDLMIEQGVYDVSHPAAGTHALFLVPILAHDAEGPCAFQVTIA